MDIQSYEEKDLTDITLKYVDFSLFHDTPFNHYTTCFTLQYLYSIPKYQSNHLINITFRQETV